MKTIPDFENELKAIDPRIVIVPNHNRPGLSNIKIDGQDICPIPSEEIRDEVDHDYRYLFPNGYNARHNSRAEALAKVASFLEFMKSPEGKETFSNKE